MKRGIIFLFFSLLAVFIVPDVLAADCNWRPVPWGGIVRNSCLAGETCYDYGLATNIISCSDKLLFGGDALCCVLPNGCSLRNINPRQTGNIVCTNLEKTCKATFYHNTGDNCGTVRNLAYVNGVECCCNDNADCSAPYPYCSSQTCVECTATKPCTTASVCALKSNEWYWYHDPICLSGSCKLGETHCSSPTPFCDDSKGCVECVNNALCGDRKTCEDNTCVACGGPNQPCCSGQSPICDGGALCTDGKCVASSCTDTCTTLQEGDKKCDPAATNKVQICTDGCWTSYFTCDTGKTCTGAGSCGCDNKCTNLERTCSGDGYVVCGNYDKDSCTEWSSLTPCTDYCIDASKLQVRTCNPDTDNCENSDPITCSAGCSFATGACNPPPPNPIAVTQTCDAANHPNVTLTWTVSPSSGHNLLVFLSNNSIGDYKGGGVKVISDNPATTKKTYAPEGFKAPSDTLLTPSTADFTFTPGAQYYPIIYDQASSTSFTKLAENTNPFTPIDCTTTCSALNQPCCPSEPECDSSLGCNSDDKCVPCGDENKPCCSIGAECTSPLECSETTNTCQSCIIEKIEWRSSSGQKINTTVKGTDVYAVIVGSEACDPSSYKINLTIKEKGLSIAGISIDDEIKSQKNLDFSSNPIRYQWKAVFDSNMDFGPQSLYYFVIKYNPEELSEELKVLECNEFYSTSKGSAPITKCDHYNNVTDDKKGQCIADCNGAALKEASSVMQNPYCKWVTSSGKSKCVLDYNTDNSPAEECMIDYQTMPECGPNDAYRSVAYIPKRVTGGVVGSYSADCEIEVPPCGPDTCVDQIVCPRLVQLPFFNAFNLIATIAVIAVVYILYIYFYKKPKVKSSIKLKTGKHKRR
jgi:hypothetical protein